MKTKQWLITLAMCIASQSSHAGIMADLNQMFMSNATPSGLLTTRDRTGVFGGSVSVRAPVTHVNLVAFDPPRLDASCGGVDLYGGSFSFINGKELIAIMRSVASNAAGLAFKAAINVISPSLGNLIQEFAATLQSMNNLAKNSCSLAHLIVDPAEKAIGNAIHGDGQTAAVEKSMFTDAAAGLKSFREDADKFLKKSGEVNPRSGNLTVKAILASGSGAILGMAGLPNKDGSADDATNMNSLNNKILLSFLGYEISGIPCSSSNADGVPDTSLNVSNNNLGRILCRGASLLTLEDFVRGGGVGSNRPDIPLRVYTCKNPAGTAPANGGFDPQVCTSMQIDNFSYEGIDGWVNRMIFGSPDDSAVIATSIMGVINSGVSGNFTSDQVKFIHQSGVPLVGLLQKTSNVDARMNIARRLRVPIVNCVAAELGSAIYKAAKGIQNGNSYDLSEDAKRSIEQIRSDALAKRNACLQDRSVLDVVMQLNESSRLVGGNNR